MSEESNVMIHRDGDRNQKPSASEKPFEEVAVEYRDRIRKEVGKEDAQRYMEMANGILVFFPKELRKTVVSTYGEIMAARGQDFADSYLEALKDLYRTERDARKELTVTKRAVEEASSKFANSGIPSWVPLRGTLLKFKGGGDLEGYFQLLKKQIKN